MKIKTVDMSGMGGTYEQGIQKAIWLGVNWIQGKPTWIWDNSGEARATGHAVNRLVGQEIVEEDSMVNLVGVYHTGEGLRDLEELWFRDPFLEEGGMSGAMHQWAMSHLRYLHKNGYKAWLKHMKKCRPPGDFYEIDLSEPPYEIELTEEARRFLER